MQAVAAELSGYAGKFPLLFREERLKTVCFDSFTLTLKQTRGVCLRARNEFRRFGFCVIVAG
jgi:hypothetical protein